MWQCLACTFAIIIMPEVIMGQSEVEHCLSNQQCWVEYNFKYDAIWSDCSGKQYITRTKYPEAPYLGVVLCTQKRYKLFLSTAPWEEFLNIADGSGHGQDHCELVGGSEETAVLPNDFWDSPSTTGFYRSSWGNNFRKGRIGFGPKDMSAWTGNYFTRWYECGVAIPGQKQVVPAMDTDFPITAPTEETPGTSTRRMIDIEVSTAGVTSPTSTTNDFPMIASTEITSWTSTRSMIFEQTSTASATSPTPTQTPSPTRTNIERCLNSQQCWVEYNFKYDAIWSDCSGKQYITRTKYPEAPYLGVVLCTQRKYKLFLSTAPSEEFLNIADSNGHGQDHCELVGGSEETAVLPNDFWDSPSTTGFYRGFWGKHFEKGPIGYGPKDGSAWTGKYFTKWYKCGKRIPGRKQVIHVTDFPE